MTDLQAIITALEGAKRDIETGLISSGYNQGISDAISIVREHFDGFANAEPTNSTQTTKSVSDKQERTL